MGVCHVARVVLVNSEVEMERGGVYEAMVVIVC